jgi:hypothetical protein
MCVSNVVDFFLPPIPLLLLALLYWLLLVSWGRQLGVAYSC